MSDLISVPAVTKGVSITQAALDERTKLVGALKLITKVHTALMQARATESAVKARTFLKRVEAARKEVKAPVLALCGEIDDAAHMVSSPLETEIKRIDGLLTVYVVAERQRLAAEAEAARQQERQKIAAAEAEAKRIREAAAAQAAAAPNPVAAQQALDLGAATAKQVEAAAMAPVTVMPPPRPSGMRVRENRWTYEVEDLKALAAHEDGKFVRIEANASAIAAAITLGVRSIPGVRIFEDTKVNTSASR